MSLAADANLAEGLCLHEELELNNLKFLIYPAGTRRPTISRTEGIIQFNSIYLCAKLNSHRPITKLAQVVQRIRRRTLVIIQFFIIYVPNQQPQY
jgi:hypothetical protein